MADQMVYIGFPVDAFNCGIRTSEPSGYRRHPMVERPGIVIQISEKGGPPLVPVLIIRAQHPRPPVKNGNGSHSLNLTRRLGQMPWYTSGFQ